MRKWESRGRLKGDIVPAPERRAAGPGKWPAPNMNGLQCPGGLGARGLSFGPLSCSAGPSHKGQLGSHSASGSGRSRPRPWQRAASGNVYVCGVIGFGDVLEISPPPPSQFGFSFYGRDFFLMMYLACKMIITKCVSMSLFLSFGF